MIKIYLNGKPKRVNEKTNLKQFLNQNKIKGVWLAVMINGEIIEKRDYAKTVLKQNDAVEAVKPLGGG